MFFIIPINYFYCLSTYLLYLFIVLYLYNHILHRISNVLGIHDDTISKSIENITDRKDFEE